MQAETSTTVYKMTCTRHVQECTTSYCQDDMPRLLAGAAPTEEQFKKQAAMLRAVRGLDSHPTISGD